MLHAGHTASVARVERLWKGWWSHHIECYMRQQKLARFRRQWQRHGHWNIACAAVGCICLCHPSGCSSAFLPAYPIWFLVQTMLWFCFIFPALFHSLLSAPLSVRQQNRPRRRRCTRPWDLLFPLHIALRTCTLLHRRQGRSCMQTSKRNPFWRYRAFDVIARLISDGCFCNRFFLTASVASAYPSSAAQLPFLPPPPLLTSRSKYAL